MGCSGEFTVIGLAGLRVSALQQRKEWVWVGVEIGIGRCSFRMGHGYGVLRLCYGRAVLWKGRTVLVLEYGSLGRQAWLPEKDGTFSTAWIMDTRDILWFIVFKLRWSEVTAHFLRLQVRTLTIILESAKSGNTWMDSTLQFT